MRRQVGVGRAQTQQRSQAAFKEKGTELTEANLEHAVRSVAVFREQLDAFAREHGDEIRRNAAFRQKFAQMCARIGVDPLASKKGFWSAMLGLGDFYFELGVQVVTVTMATRELNGGLLSVDELLAKLAKLRSRTAAGAASAPQISRDDVLRAVEKLSVLGNGLRVSRVGGRDVLISVPVEISRDSEAALELAAKRGDARVSLRALVAELSWSEERARRALNDVAACGMAWYDAPADEMWCVAFIEGGLAV